MTLPPGPGLNPIDLVKFVRDPLACFADNVEKYGDPFSMKFPMIGTIVFTADPAGLREIFTASVDTFSVGDPDFLGPVLGEHSMLVISGEPHKRQRQLLAPPLHGKRMRAYASLMCAVTRELSADFAEEQTINALDLVQRITMRIIVRAIFGLEDLDKIKSLEVLLREIMRAVGPVVLFAKPLRRDLGPHSPWGHFLRLKDQLSALVREEIALRRREPKEREDILSLMMDARDEAGAPMGEQEILDELATLLVAGHETTASTLAWALYFIHRDPRVFEALHRELDAVPEDARPDGYAKLDYLGAVVSETLRIHPAVPETTRRLNVPFALKGHELPAGTILMPAIYLAHRNPEVYRKPLSFRPERFLERKFTPYEFVPFGGGARRCIGYAFAEYEMKMVLATLLGAYDLRLAEGQTITPERTNLAIAPSGGVELVVSGRRT